MVGACAHYNSSAKISPTSLWAGLRLSYALSVKPRLPVQRMAGEKVNQQVTASTVNNQLGYF
jgi:hypothetical protein